MCVSFKNEFCGNWTPKLVYICQGPYHSARQVFKKYVVIQIHKHWHHFLDKQKKQYTHLLCNIFSLVFRISSKSGRFWGSLVFQYGNKITPLTLCFFLEYKVHTDPVLKAKAGHFQLFGSVGHNSLWNSVWPQMAPKRGHNVFVSIYLLEKLAFFGVTFFIVVVCLLEDNIGDSKFNQYTNFKRPWLLKTAVNSMFWGEPP